MSDRVAIMVNQGDPQQAAIPLEARDAMTGLPVAGWGGAPMLVSKRNETSYIQYVVTGCTAATPPVLTTAAAHNLIGGETVMPASVGGISGLPLRCKVGTVTPTTMQLLNLDGTSPTSTGAYTSGGTLDVTKKWSVNNMVETTKGGGYLALSNLTTNAMNELDALGNIEADADPSGTFRVHGSAVVVNYDPTAAGSGGGILKNASFSGFQFVMTNSSTHAPMTGLTVTATRSLDGAGFSACSNAVTEIANGWYKIDLSSADTNGNNVALRFTAAGADDRNIAMVTES